MEEEKVNIDKFLIDKKAEENKKALAYKLSVKLKDDEDKLKDVQEPKDLLKNDYVSIINSGSKYEVFYDEDICKIFELEIQTIHKELRDIIKKYIVAFFMVTNFGYRQNKGFGSFGVVEIDQQKVDYSEEFIKKNIEISHKNYVLISFNEKKDTKDFISLKLNSLYLFYIMLKSGINQNGYYKKSFLRQYFSTPTEKTEIKKKFFDTGYRERYQASNSMGLFYRALLGLPANYRYSKYRGSKPLTIEISSVKKRITRFKSPLTIKVFENSNYVLIEDIEKDIYETTFRFKVKQTNYDSGKKIHKMSEKKLQRNEYSMNETLELRTPTKEEFNLNDLIKSYVEWFKYNIDIEENRYEDIRSKLDILSNSKIEYISVNKDTEKQEG
ncbi:MAG: hypothetical protein ACOYWZ_01400 [Bacillota bacterium]